MLMISNGTTLYATAAARFISVLLPSVFKYVFIWRVAFESKTELLASLLAVRKMMIIVNVHGCKRSRDMQID